MINTIWSIEEVNIEQVICNESACNEWIWEVIDWHCVIIQSKVAIYVKLVRFNLFRQGSCFFTEHS